MPETQILHISDTHLGYRQYRSDTRRDDFRDNFEQAITEAIDRDVDAVVHTGDLFHDSNPSVRDLHDCGELFARLEAAGIPTYGIVGNHDRKADKQLLDLARRMGNVERLDREPTLVGDVALYGIDAVPPRSWDTTSFELTPPPSEANATILCLHQSFVPPLDGDCGDHDLSAVLDRVGIDLDGVALGHIHKPESTEIDGTDVWYAGSTARTQKTQDDRRTVQLVETRYGSIRRTQICLDTRQFETMTVEFGPDDGIGRLRDRLGQQSLDDAVVALELTGEDGPMTTNEAKAAADEAGAAVVAVNDKRGRNDLAAGDIDVREVDDHETVVTERIDDEEFASVVETVDDRIRTDGSMATNTQAAATELRPTLEEAMEEAFGEGDGDPPGDNGQTTGDTAETAEVDE